MRLQRRVVFDPKTERFGDDRLANSFIEREQRKGFEIGAWPNREKTPWRGVWEGDSPFLDGGNGRRLCRGGKLTKWKKTTTVRIEYRKPKR